MIREGTIAVVSVRAIPLGKEITMLKNTLADIVGRTAARKLPKNIGTLAMMTIDEMVERGVPIAKARILRASVTLAREVCEPDTEYRPRIASPAMAIEYCRRRFTELLMHGQQEEFWIVTLGTKNQPINTHRITVGTLSNSLVHPREVFRPAIADAANCILVVHNHPSGDPTPSDQDISVTERLEAAAEIIGTPVIDHIIVAKERCISLQEWRQSNK